MLRTWADPEQSVRDADCQKAIPFEAFGSVNLSGAHIGGNLDCTGGQFNANDVGPALDAYGIRIDRTAYLNGAHRPDGSFDACMGYFSATGPLRFEQAIIDGNLDLNGARLNAGKDGMTALAAREVKVKGDVLLGTGDHTPDQVVQAFSATGCVDLHLAKVNGNLKFTGASITANSKREAICLSEAEIDGNALFDAEDDDAEDDDKNGDKRYIVPKSITQKPITLKSRAAKPRTPKTTKYSFNTDGRIALYLAKIKGDLEFRNASFAKTPVGTHSSDCRHIFNGVQASFVSVTGALHWQRVKTRDCTIVDLRNGHAGVLRDAPGGWPKPWRLFVDGFSYENIGQGPMDLLGRKPWLDWPVAEYHPEPYDQLAQVMVRDGLPDVARDVLIEKENARQRHSIVSLVDSIAGQTMRRPWRPPVGDERAGTDDSNNIAQIIAYDDPDEQPNVFSRVFVWLSRVISFGEWTFELLSRYTVHYGYAPLQASVWIVLFVVFGSYLFGYAYKQHVLMPTEKVAYTEFVEHYETPAYYQEFHPLVYSFEAFFPLVDLHQEEFWLPKDDRGQDVLDALREMLRKCSVLALAVALVEVCFSGVVAGLTVIGVFALVRVCVELRRHPLTLGTVVRRYLWLHVTMGWVLATLVVVGLTDLIHKM
jgi:hypothetical protein